MKNIEKPKTKTPDAILIPKKKVTIPHHNLA